MTRRSVSTFLVVMVCLAGSRAAAQQAPESADPPAHISFVDGAAVLERDGRTDSDPSSMPLLAGDRVRTQGGRLEVLFGDGSTLHLDANTTVDFQSDAVVRLLTGRIRLTVTGPARDLSYRIDAPSAWVQISDPGEYRVTVLREAEVELAVLRGSAELVNEQGRSYIRAGERTFARDGAAPSPSYVFNSAAWDSFDRWSETRRDQRLGVSTQYLPNDVRPYASVFDNHGSWRYEQVYGHVWYPRVSVGWRPYHRGRWASLRPYGWTWISGGDPWGWPTHHYGRWGFSAGSWFWIPGRTWGPAWVSWAYAPGYVSWCPLGWNNRPVLQIVNVNAYGGRRYDPWDAWTVVPRHHFASAYVNVRNINRVRIDQRIHNTFVVGHNAPEARYAVGRTGTPIRSAGRYAVPRSGPAGVSPGTQPADAGRAIGDSRAIAGDRRFPTAARRPGTPTQPERGDAAGSTGGRAVSRDRGALGDPGALTRDRGASADPGTAARETPAPSGAPAGISRSTAGAPREYRRVPDSIGRQRDGDTGVSDAPVTAAPSGAVRAVPRVRDRESAAPAYPSPRSLPQTPPATRPSDDRAPYSAVPRYRSNPDAGVPSRGRSVDRQEAAPAAPVYRAAPPPQPSSDPGPRPSYRTAPEPRPSSPPPSAAPAPRSGGERAAPGGGERSGPRGGGVRERSAESAPSGQAVRRRR